jgi:hypothetical protein
MSVAVGILYARTTTKKIHLHLNAHSQFKDPRVKELLRLMKILLSRLSDLGYAIVKTHLQNRLFYRWAFSSLR